MSSRAAQTIGVLGAGTMGSGIAQLAAKTGARTLLHDPVPAALAPCAAVGSNATAAISASPVATSVQVAPATERAASVPSSSRTVSRPWTRPFRDVIRTTSVRERSAPLRGAR